MTTYARRDGLYDIGKDEQGRTIWKFRGRVDGVPFNGTYHGLKTDAKTERDKMRTAAREGSLANDRAVTVEAFFEKYISHRITTGQLREGKVATTYRSYVRRYIAPLLPTKLADVRTKHAQTIPDAMIAAGLTQSTPQVKALCVGGMAQALRWKLIPLNPFDGVEWPKVTRPETRSPSSEQVRKIIEKTDEEYRVAVALDATVGLRASELAALRWEDVNLTGGTCDSRNGCPSYAHLHVEGGMQRVNGALVRTPPKTKRGRRWVPLADSAIAMLKKYRRDQVERQLALGEAWQDHGLVFDHFDGRPTDPNLFGKAFMRAARKAKVKGYTFHGLRHYFCTSAVNSGLDPATVSRIAGHSTVAFTLQVYFHPSETTAAPLAGAVESALGDALGRL